jgi:hypothetical protein
MGWDAPDDRLAYVFIYDRCPATAITDVAGKSFEIDAAGVVSPT